MAAATCLLSEEELMCSICCELYVDPVTTPCGHNFCNSCLTKHWDRGPPFTCPLCKEIFPIRPQLRTNTFISAMVSQFSQRAQDEPDRLRPVLHQEAGGEVSCDVCSEHKLKALKSCLVCLASYCDTHLEPHRQAPPLQKHQLITPVQDLKDRSCSRHHKPLELFCETDQTLICIMCSVLDHKNHELVPLKEACEAKQQKLKKVECETEEIIQKRRQKIREVQQSLELSQTAAEEETAEGVHFFTAMVELFQEGLNQVLQEIEDKQTKAKRQAEDLIQGLEQEIRELDQRSTELKQLSCSEDHLHVLQTFTSIRPAPDMYLTRTLVTPPSFFGTVHRAVFQAKKKLQTMEPKPLSKKQLKVVQQFAAEVTLDPDTAHPELGLSDDLKQVWYTSIKKNLPDNPKRFTAFHGIVGKQSISSGAFYFEVRIEGGDDWAVGVAKESVQRKECVYASSSRGFWTIFYLNANVYAAMDTTLQHFSVKSVVEKVGVFVDYEQGLVCFYNADTAELLYCFSDCNFTEKLHPFFYTSIVKAEKSTLTITPVRTRK